jgi:hypothetical protein
MRSSVAQRSAILPEDHARHHETAVRQREAQQVERATMRACAACAHSDAVASGQNILDLHTRSGNALRILLPYRNTALRHPAGTGRPGNDPK